MSNSSLVNYTRISPNQYNPRNHKIDTITIHCMAGQLTPETCGAIFAAPSRQASSNYSVGCDARYGLYVNESSGSWCSSSYENDMRAITIEVASDSFYPYKVKDKVYEALIKLVVDICKRNGIKKLKWSSKRDDRVNHRNGCNVTLHRDFSATACPGDYLASRMSDICKRVNAKLNTSNKVTLKSSSPIYQYAYKDVLGKSSKVLKSLKKGAKVTWIKDDGWGWSQVKSGTTTGWIMNGHLKKDGLSKFAKLTLGANRKAIIIKKNKKAGTRILKKGTKYTLYCTITHGEYKGKSYIGIGKKRYYI